jgi:hypothetical protein
MEYLANANPWSILGWLMIAFIAGVSGWAGLAVLGQWWQNSDWRRNKFRSTGT